MKTKLFLVVLLLATGIYFASKQSDNKSPVITNVIAPYHIILGLDTSGTTKGNGWPMPDKSFFEQQIIFLEQNGGGVLEIYNLANSIPSSIKLRIDSIEAKPNIYSGEQEVKKVEQLNKSITLRNESSKNAFWKQLEARVINYQPINGQDYTYALHHCKSINQSLLLPQYSGYNQFVLLYSDLLDDTPKSKEKTVPKDVLTQIAGLSNLSICNYTTDSNYEDVGASIIPDYNDFIDLIKTTSLTTKN